jgi:hypothetical protein
MGTLSLSLPLPLSHTHGLRARGVALSGYRTLSRSPPHHTRVTPTQCHRYSCTREKVADGRCAERQNYHVQRNNGSADSSLDAEAGMPHGAGMPDEPALAAVYRRSMAEQLEIDLAVFSQLCEEVRTAQYCTYSTTPTATATATAIRSVVQYSAAATAATVAQLASQPALPAASAVGCTCPLHVPTARAESGAQAEAVGLDPGEAAR